MKKLILAGWVYVGVLIYLNHTHQASWPMIVGMFFGALLGAYLVERRYRAQVDRIISDLEELKAIIEAAANEQK